MLDKKQEIKFKSSPENIHQVEKFVDIISDEFNINNTYFGNIVIALTEAVTNAINHGNRNNPEKNVTVTFKSKPKGLLFTVKDEGDGFNLENIPDPTDIANDTSINEGRGIFLMKSLADEVKFSDNGRKIELFFNIASINQELAANRVSQLKSYSKTKARSKIK